MSDVVKVFGCPQAHENRPCTNPRGCGDGSIARELGISHSTVREYLARIAAAGITWPLPVEVTDQEPERRLFGNVVCGREPVTTSSRGS
jgi:hypothetical protein